MRVLVEGPDIPDELIATQEKGQTLFICGAGVSVGAGLPTFRGLVTGIYDFLNEEWTHHHAEREGMEENGRLFGQYDRVIRCLERRLGGPNPRRNRRMRERIRFAVRERLKPQTGSDLSNHAALLELSCDEIGNSRVLTTNFDTLFERARLLTTGVIPPSHSGVALPQPKSSNFSGVLHLHGRLADDDLGLAETNLVLTSAEFGDAYLRTGWASRYVYDLVRTHTVVLVGYQADDPPMRYLLEALEADRERYSDLNKVYAFAPAMLGQEELEGELWRAKGVEPIIYLTKDGGKDHSNLYDSLREWQRYAVDPTEWRRYRLAEIFRSPLEDASEIARNDCVRLLSHNDATELLGELSPDPAWLPFLASRGLFKPGATHFGLWAASRITEPEMIRQVAGAPRIDETARWHLERALERSDPALSEILQRAWRLILKESVAAMARPSDQGWFAVEPRLRRGEIGYEERAIICDMFKPQLRINKPYSFQEKYRTAGEENLHDLVRVDFAASEYPHPSDVLPAIPADPKIEREVIFSLDRALQDSLEQAHDVGFLSGWDAASSDVPSIAPHAQNRYRTGFYSIVRMIADLWLRLLAGEPATAREIAERWGKSRWPLIKRLWLFALESSLFDPDEVADALITVDDRDFWVSNSVVEVMRALTARWHELSLDKRSQLEQRMCAGVPRAIYIDDIDEDRWRSIHDSSIFRRLSRLATTGCAISDKTQQTLRDIIDRRLDWEPGKADRDDFTTWSELSTGPEGDPAKLAGIPDESLVAEAMRLQQDERHNQGDVWRLFAGTDPERALRGLMASAENGAWDSASWRDFINVAAQSDLAKIQADVAKAVLVMPIEIFSDQKNRIASWLRGKRISITAEAGEQMYFDVWDRLADITYTAQDVVKPGDEKDLMFEALNRAGGVLAWTLLEALGSSSSQPGSGLGKFRGRFDRLVNATGREGVIARLLLAESLAYLYQTDPTWTYDQMVGHLRWQHQEAAIMWHGYSRGHMGSADLFVALKPDLLDAFTLGRLNNDDLDNLAGRLTSIAFWHQIGEGLEFAISSAEIKRAISSGPTSVRRHVSWQLWRSMLDKAADPMVRGNHWRNQLGLVFNAIWPLDARLREQESSQNLVRMAQESGNAFPEAVEAILNFIVPYQLYNLAYSMRLTKDQDTLIKKYPDEMLRLIDVLIDPAIHPVPRGISKFLDDCVSCDPSVRRTDSYRRLLAISRSSIYTNGPY